VKKVHEVREKGSPEDVKAAVERLEKASHKAAEELYKSAGAPGAAPGEEGAPKPPEGKKEDVVDAEYKQV
jgi:molecular chaperone DnaK